MAILGKCEVQVIVDGTPAEEYDDDEEEEVTDNDETVTKYVEAVAGAHFAVKFLLQPSYHFTRGEDSVTAYVEIDGHPVGGRMLERDKFLNQRTLGFSPWVLIDGQHATENGVNALYKFQFSDLETRDLDKTDDLDKFREKYGHLGTITVQLWREQKLGSCNVAAYKARHIGSVPEKALKGRPLDVAIRMVRSTPDKGINSWSTRTLDQQPLAKFIFKYRTRRALQSLLIIERSPTPLPIEERPIDDLSREELQNLVRRQREEQSITKQENGGVKRERSGTVTDVYRPLKSSKGARGETIYHLDSDGEEEEEKTTRDEIGVVENDGSETDEDIEIIQL
ncbi:hypothetical protein LTR99_003284 [Exophiala xenobiotica]|uniref:DUF7918 domain-containing protein n=1 Tax=Vermiconidia calcicola TaxID=1690605 RepID=A0AAV9QA25_9PEZI|nr:hypothetical protein LTR72_009061 [Exophiala xenobiotica]KAK5538951.1 hypothetical protein LTR25_004495 [Vermiconidia calcicola]KAK5540479.1 hypothetical protein LTR23_006161 [Chaetothyriales sp. CCFEE 6169]KAK5281113.1 hypothetical protein LTR40_005364 [Exophiala xenobiotica]KAK5288579.1 hypothetical protein LTR14_007929 [Exophiala xenobiotica]